MNRTNNERNLGMKQTINRISNRVGDWFATLFALTALLLVPHAIIRPIIGYGLHHWIPIQWLALHAMLIILTLCVALAAYIIADRTGNILKGAIMADQKTIPISLETQNKVAKAIYLRWHRNGHRHPRPWNEMATEDKEPWRRVAKDAISTFFGSPEFQTLLDDVYDEGYDDAEKDAKGKNEGVQ